MSQHDMVLDNGPGLAVRTDMNAAIQALVSTSSGPTEPTTTYAGQIWLDTSVGTNGTLRQRNQANSGWVVPSFTSSGAADLFFGSKPSPDRFVVNDVAAGTGTDVFTVREDGSVVAAIALSFIRQQVITTTGAITLHADTKAFLVEVQGGGGGAGGAAPAGASQGSAGGGGGGGAYASKWILRVAGLVPTCTVGAFAVGGSGGGAPGVGNTSSYSDGTNTVTAAGGAQGGAGASSSSISNQGGSGGLLPTTGDINVPGEAGDYAYVIWITANQCRAGKGGNSRFGAGGYSLGVTTGTAVGSNGVNGTGKGAGGSGGYSMNGGGTWNGGSGSAGIVIITEFR